MTYISVSIWAGRFHSYGHDIPNKDEMLIKTQTSSKTHSFSQCLLCEGLSRVSSVVELPLIAGGVATGEIGQSGLVRVRFVGAGGDLQASMW